MEAIRKDVWDCCDAAGTGLGTSKAFYIEQVGLQTVVSHFLEASDGRVGLTVGHGVNQLFVCPARVSSSGNFTLAVIKVSDVRVAVEEMRGRSVEFEEHDTWETGTENGIARTATAGGEGACFEDSEGDPVGVAGALAD